MTDPSLALDKAIRAALIADAAVRGMVGSRVYDVVPAAPQFPYLSLGAGQLVPQPAEGLDRSCEVYVTLDAWSRKPGRIELKQICGAVLDCLLAADLDLGPDLALVQLNDGGTRTLLDADGLTGHGILTLRALVDQA